jgi:hypothetical protein
MSAIRPSVRAQLKDADNGFRPPKVEADANDQEMEGYLALAQGLSAHRAPRIRDQSSHQDWEHLNFRLSPSK